MNLLERTETNTPSNEAKIRGMEKGFCQSCKTSFPGTGDLCKVCRREMHRELDKVFKEYPYPCDERLNAIRGVKAGYGYKVY